MRHKKTEAQEVLCSLPGVTYVMKGRCKVRVQESSPIALHAFPTVGNDLDNQKNVLNGQLGDERDRARELLSRVLEIQLEVWDRTGLWILK